MKTLYSKLICFLLITCSIAGCKKDAQNPTPQPDGEKATVVAIDGKNYTVDKTAVKTTLYTDAATGTTAADVLLPLDKNGAQLKFFIADVKTGSVALSTKKGTSLWIEKNPALKVNATGGQKTLATISTTNQTYIQYSFGGNSYYGVSGKIDIKYDAATGVLNYSWAVTFRDANGREFTTSGAFEYNIKTSVTKPATDIVDPTPVSTQPTIESITPVAGLQGTEVTIAGTNFSTAAADNVVKFNGVAAVVKTASETKLVVTAPVTTTGKITVKVKNSDTSEGPTFTYQAVPTVILVSPNRGKVGDTTNITGTNFSTTATDNVVSFTASGAVATNAVVIQATATTLKVIVPATAATGAVNVSVKGLAAIATDNIYTITTTTNPPQPGPNGTTTVFSYTSNKYITDADGNSFVYDMTTTGNSVHRILKYSKTGQLVKTFTKDDFPGHNAPFTSLNFGTDKNANVYVYLVGYEGATKKTNIFKIERNTNAVTVLRSMANFADDGFAGSLKLSGAKSFYVDAEENIIFADNNFSSNTAYNIMKINKANVMTTLVDKTKLSIDATAAAPHGALSTDIAFDAAENLYVASISSNPTYANVFSILKFDNAMNKSTIYATGLTGGLKQTVIDPAWSMNINQSMNLDYRLRVSKDGKIAYLAQTYGIYKINTDTKKIDLFGQDITKVTDALNAPLRVASFFYAENAGMLFIYNGTIDGTPSKVQSVAF